MKRILIAAVALTGLISPGPAVAATGEAAALRRDLGPSVRVAEHRETGKVRFVGASAGRPIARPGNLRSSAGAPQVARAFLDRHGAAFGIDDQAEELRVESSHSGAAGHSSVRLQQLRDGIPVLGGELVVNLDRARNVLSASGEVLPGSVPTTPRVSSTAARDAAVAAVAKQRGVSAVRLSATMPELWIYDARLLGGPGPQRPVLVWRLEVEGEDALAIDQLILVDARLGSVALNIDQIEEVGKDRRVCNANNSNSNVPCVAPVRTEGQGPVGVQDVDDAYDFSGETYDFLAGLGRDSLDGNGLPLRSTVRFCQAGCPFANAFWNGQQMVYGAGFAVDDVVGHELTHGTTDFSAHLFYYYQSGAINESLSDVFGEFVDLSNTRGTDTPTTRWLIGEDIPGVPTGIRDMEEPGSKNDPDRMTSAIYHADETDNGGVHINSGVNNKAAFLMTDGASFNGREVTGLGIPKVSRIYFRVQTAMLTSASDYADLASALPQACTELVGTAGITAADCTEVADAVAAVEMSTVPPQAPAPEAPVCDGGLVATDLFFDDLENTASGNWTAQSGWFYPQNPNPSPIGDATFATSGTTNFFGYDRPSIGDFSIAMARSVAIPSGPDAYLRFDHAYGFENDGLTAYDGGMLEISTDGGASYGDIGSLLTDGKYNGTLSVDSNNPLEGRSAFVRESNGYVASRARLSTLAGQSVRFRFRIGTDSGNLNNLLDVYGWFLDDIRIYTCAPPASPDSDGDGVADASDACPSVAAATANGCPAPTAPPATAGGTTSRPAAATLASARLRSCKLSGRGKKARMRCTLRGFRAVRRASVTVKLRGRTVARKTVRPTSRGVLSLKPLRTLRRGRYRVTIVLRDAQGRTRTLRKALRVR